MYTSRDRLKKTFKGIIFYIGVISITIVIIFPLAWMFLTSIKPLDKIFVYPPIFLGFNPQFSNYAFVWNKLNFSRLFLNSTIVALSTTVISVSIASLAGYSLARLRFPGREALGLLILVTYMFPGVLLLIPIFVLMARLHLIDTYFSLIIATTTFSLPFCTWMLRGYFATLPPDIEDAARIDGCSRLGALVRVVAPISAPGVAATSIFSFMAGWSNYLFALTLITSEGKKTLPPAIGTFITQEGIQWHLLMAGGMIATIPIILFFIVVQRYFIQGLTLGAVK
ncbi:MAG: carbohydrate ABC transporter permease [bacterium]